MRVRRGSDESPVTLENHLIANALLAPLGASALAAAGAREFRALTYNDTLDEIASSVMATQLDRHFEAVNIRPEADNSVRLKVFGAYMEGDDIAEALGRKSASNATKNFLHAVATDEINTAKQISFLRHTCDTDQDVAVKLLTRGWHLDYEERFRDVFEGLHPEGKHIVARHLIGESRQQIAASTPYSEVTIAARLHGGVRWLERGMGASILAMRTPHYFPDTRDAVTNDLAQSLDRIASGIDALPLRQRAGQQENVRLLTLIAGRRSSRSVIQALARLTSRWAVRNVLKHGLDAPPHV